MSTLTKQLIAILTLVIVSSVPSEAVTRATQSIVPLSLRLPEVAGSATACVLRNNGDTVLSFWHGIVTGDRFATYINPLRCTSSPEYPFSVQKIDLTMYENYGGVWPVEVVVEIWLPAGSDSCSGPSTLVCADTVLLDQASFKLPSVGTISLSRRCCVTRPFFVAIRYTGGTSSPYPSVTFDSRMPGDSCVNWGYATGFGWSRWNQYWAAPVPGNLVLWVEGETSSAVCGATGCCTGRTGNVDGDISDVVDISDLSALVGYLFQGEAISDCADEDNVDADPSGAIDISDLQALVDFLFSGAELPACP
jgi:hypothetical protein